ncbi:transport protein particle complex II subunit TRS130 [Lachancea thermotolerans CBS 6340]|uniref:KLTH0D12628p n=1 Tax=Lachancea thermotolerans (strain ATCC 56472 / CBS 6340 / NRRL Y-8284) TaxID=559295 RepID=C5DF67_LACTC|nr:KLTH0D12628p [Lachancea thermotolerans CBS 6340]CAR22822.1 KLTH0D12628p [Lachancea thermotolerans CBS 6340]
MSDKHLTNPVCFSYFDPFNAFGSIQSELEDRLPFRNLHWKPSNQNLRTIAHLPIEIIPETDESMKKCGSEPLIMFLVIICTSIDDYRAKVRPLIRQWLPPPGSNKDAGSNVSEAPAKRIVLLHSNSDISETNLFKTVSFYDKFSKDFPFLTAIEVKSIYKSEKEKTNFWNSTVNQLRKYTMEVFQQRLGYLETKLRKVPEGNTMELASLQESILNLFLAFHLNDEASKELESLRHTLFTQLGPKLSKGELEVPFQFSHMEPDVSKNSIAFQLAKENLTIYQLNRFFLIKQCELIQKSYQQTARNLRLYQLVRSFLWVIQNEFNESPMIAQFKYSFLESLNHAGIFDIEKTTTFREIQADFEIIQRDCWLDMAFGQHSFRLNGRIYPPNKVSCSSDDLKSSFENEDVFQLSFLERTKNIITLLNECNSKRYRIVDLYSVEVALLYHQRKEYQKAIDILQSCHEYYKDSCWNELAIKLLECFVDCLIKCPETHVITLGEEDVPVATVLSNSILDLLASTQSGERKAFWWDLFLSINREGGDSLMYPLDNLFEIKVENELHIARPNVYALRVKVSSQKLPQDVSVAIMRVLLKNDLDEFLEFKLIDTVIRPGDNEVYLEATEISFGNFEIISTESTVGNTIFCKEFSGPCASISLVKPLSSHNFGVAVLSSKRLELTKNSIHLKYSNVDIPEKFKLVLTIIPPQGEAQSPVAFSADGKKLSVTVTGFDTSYVEYFILHPIDEFTLKQELSFNVIASPNHNFYEKKVEKVSCALPLSISVEDIARENCFFFKFLISSSLPTEPVLFYKSCLESYEPKKYTVTGGFEPEAPILLRNRLNETSLSFFKIATQDGAKFDSVDSFQLKVRFSTLKGQIDHLVTSAILIQGYPDIASKMELYRDVWNSSVLGALSYDYDLFESDNIIKLVSSKESVEAIRKLLVTRVRDEGFLKASSRCLFELYKGFQLSHIEIKEYTKDLETSELVVGVHLPSPSKFFSVNLKAETTCEQNLKVGQLLPVDIQIDDLSSCWASESRQEKNYIFELSNSSEWIINGKRRFCLCPGKSEYRVHMIPLRRGYLKYPRVEISEDGKKAPEVYYSNMHETILIA